MQQYAVDGLAAPRGGACVLARVAVSVAVLVAGTGAATAADATAHDILAASGASGGLVVHVGCGDGRRTAALCGGGAYLVHGLSSDPSEVAQAREHIRAVGLPGRVTIERSGGSSLPYVDGLANLVVVEGTLRDGASEVIRVLCPRGLAMVREAGNEAWLARVPYPVSRTVAGFAAFRKPVPAEMDDWTHFLHGPDGHVMSDDLVVGPPYHIQWIGSPAHARSHVHLTTVNVMVSAGGRLFYIADESPTALPEALPSRWGLIARDAFNGIELWRRPLSSWQPYYVKDRNSYPADLHRRLVAADGLVFATLSIHGPVSALDPATGRTVRTYAGTERTEDIVHEDGVLYLSMNTGAPEQIDRLQMAYRHVEPQQKRVVAIRAGSGSEIWEKSDRDTDGLMPMTLAVKGERLYVQNAVNVVCLAKATGVVLWRSSRPSEYVRPGWSSPTLVAFDDVVISADRQSGPGQKVGKDQYAAGGFSTGDLVAFSAETGVRLWSAPCAEGCRAPTDVFGLDGTVRFGTSLERRVHEYRQVHDLRTGEVLSEAPADETWPRQHHHRCYRDKATRKYILAGRTGVEFIELATGKVRLHSWLRGNCKFGVLPANGLLYMPPEQCGCYIESKLTGFHALAPRRETQFGAADAHPLERGPAYGRIENPGTRGGGGGEWPTFRCDNARSGRTTAAVPTELRRAWRTDVGGRLTQPVVAHGKLLVASIEEHTLLALDAETGVRLWRFETGGRIDSPPTVAGGLAVFGCRDGWIYALRCSDGQLVWRYRAAPGDRMLVNAGRLESVWPVHGSVLVQDGVVLAAAGRSSYVDGGVRMVGLDLLTGRSLMTRTFYSRDRETGDAVPLYEPFPAGKRLVRMEMPGVLPDVLSSDGARIWMRAVTFDTELAIQQDFPPHLFSSAGFLDDSWWELSYWLYGPHMYGGRAGVAEATRRVPTARIMVCDDDRVYGAQDGYEGVRTAGFIASKKAPKTEVRKRGNRKIRRVLHDWRKSTPVHVFGLVLAGDTLFLAGPPRIDESKTREALKALATDEYEPPPVLKDAAETFAGQRGGLLCALRRDDGADVAEMELASVPVFDGLIAAQGRLYAAMKDGSVICLK